MTSKWKINLKTTFCPKCKTKMPKCRLPRSFRELLWGGWTCPKCGAKLDKWGTIIEE